MRLALLCAARRRGGPAVSRVALPRTSAVALDSMELKDQGRGKWTFRGYEVKARSREEAVAKLDAHYQEIQEMTSQVKKRRRLRERQRLVIYSAPLQSQAVRELRHSPQRHHGGFQGPDAGDRRGGHLHRGAHVVPNGSGKRQHCSIPR